MLRSDMTCSRCLYFDCHEECRRRAPLIVMADEKIVTVFPKVDEDCWCGEGLWRREGTVKAWGEWIDERDPFSEASDTCEDR